MATKEKPKPKMLKIPPYKKKKNAKGGILLSDLRKHSGNNALTEKEIDKLLGSR